MHLINGNMMSDLADHVITLDSPTIPFDLNTVDVIYCKTEYLHQLFEYLKEVQDKEYTLISGMLDKSIVLITGMSAKPIKRQYVKDKPKCVIRWFAVNAVQKHPQIFPIPLGIENHTGKSKGKRTNHEWLLENMERLCSKEKENVIYCNFNERTNIRQRSGVIDILKARGLKLKIDTPSLSFEQYCERMSDCKFVLCPPGKGVDTHRLWEALYLGCIPITLKSRIYQHYHLPIVQVERWEDLNKDSLRINRVYDYKELYISYWEERIRNEK